MSLSGVSCWSLLDAHHALLLGGIQGGDLLEGGSLVKPSELAGSDSGAAATAGAAAGVSAEDLNARIEHVANAGANGAAAVLRNAARLAASLAHEQGAMAARAAVACAAAGVPLAIVSNATSRELDQAERNDAAGAAATFTNVLQPLAGAHAPAPRGMNATDAVACLAQAAAEAARSANAPGAALIVHDADDAPQGTDAALAAEMAAGRVPALAFLFATAGPGGGRLPARVPARCKDQGGDEPRERENASVSAAAPAVAPAAEVDEQYATAWDVNGAVRQFCKKNQLKAAAMVRAGNRVPADENNQRFDSLSVTPEVAFALARRVRPDCTDAEARAVASIASPSAITMAVFLQRLKEMRRRSPPKPLGMSNGLAGNRGARGGKLAPIVGARSPSSVLPPPAAAAGVPSVLAHPLTPVAFGALRRRAGTVIVPEVLTRVAARHSSLIASIDTAAAAADDGASLLVAARILAVAHGRGSTTDGAGRLSQTDLLAAVMACGVGLPSSVDVHGSRATDPALCRRIALACLASSCEWASVPLGAAKSATSSQAQATPNSGNVDVALEAVAEVLGPVERAVDRARADALRTPASLAVPGGAPPSGEDLLLSLAIAQHAALAAVKHAGRGHPRLVVRVHPGARTLVDPAVFSCVPRLESLAAFDARCIAPGDYGVADVGAFERASRVSDAPTTADVAFATSGELRGVPLCVLEVLNDPVHEPAGDIGRLCEAAPATKMLAQASLPGGASLVARLEAAEVAAFTNETASSVDGNHDVGIEEADAGPEDSYAPFVRAGSLAFHRARAISDAMLAGGAEATVDTLVASLASPKPGDMSARRGYVLGAKARALVACAEHLRVTWARRLKWHACAVRALRVAESGRASAAWAPDAAAEHASLGAGALAAAELSVELASDASSLRRTLESYRVHASGGSGASIVEQALQSAKQAHAQFADLAGALSRVTL
ncbi:hypothetical protein RI054_39g145300 [Pseudoscourfieldia marina]